MSLRALVTGSNRGIGLEVVKQLLQTNKFDKIFVASRNLERGRAVVAELQSPVVEVVGLDVANSQSVEDAANQVKQKTSYLNVLVNNAAVIYGPKQVDVEQAKLTVETNYFGVRRVTDAFLPMINVSNGRIINVSARVGSLGADPKSKELSTDNLASKSVQDIDEMAKDLLDAAVTNSMDQRGWKAGYSPVYSISKRLVNAYSRILASQLQARGSNIFVGCVDPGWCRTDLGGPKAPRTVEQGAATVTYLATTDEKLESGRFWSDNKTINF